MEHNDITAIVLTIGEKSYPRAIESIHSQSIKPREVITVSNISPFYKAINHGASLVKTNFFVQVDSDMVLDPDCIENLHKSFEQDSGVVVGQLRDRLVGTVMGIKMFRSQCFNKVNFRDTVAPDTDFYNDIRTYGWETRRVLNLGTVITDKSYWYTFGLHSPEYDLQYTYNKFYVLGMRHRYWKHLTGVRYLLDKLANNLEDISYVAQIALCVGFFNIEPHDVLDSKSLNPAKGYNKFAQLFKNRTEHDHLKVVIDELNSDNLYELFVNYHKLVHSLIDNLNFEYMKVLFDQINKVYTTPWFVKMAFCSGFAAYLTDITRDVQLNYELIMKMSGMHKNKGVFLG